MHAELWVTAEHVAQHRDAAKDKRWDWLEPPLT